MSNDARCESCELPRLVEQLRKDVARLESDFSTAVTELVDATERLNGMITGHVSNLTELTVRLHTSIEDNRSAMNTLLLGLSDLSAIVRVDVHQRAQRLVEMSSAGAKQE